MLRSQAFLFCHPGVFCDGGGGDLDVETESLTALQKHAQAQVRKPVDHTCGLTTVFARRDRSCLETENTMNC